MVTMDDLSWSPAKMNKLTCMPIEDSDQTAPIEDSDQTAHLCSQTAHLCSLI